MEYDPNHGGSEPPPTPQTAGDLASEWQAIAERAQVALAESVALRREVEAELAKVKEALRIEKGEHNALREKVKKLSPRMFDPKAPRY